MNYESNPAIAIKDRENDENARYSDWFQDNLDENIEQYTREEWHNKDAIFDNFERLHGIYTDTYDTDEDFEYWCQNVYEGLR